MLELTAGKDDAMRRLDRIIRKALPELPLSLIHRLFRQKKILVDNKSVSISYRIKQGMVIRVFVDVNHTHDKVNNDNVNHGKSQVNKRRPNLKILWQGSGIIVFNKPSGLSTHGRNSLESIVNAVSVDSDGKGGDSTLTALPRSLSFKPGPLHRLDKPTSGIIIFSQTLEGAKLFSALIREHKLEKIYLAIVEGIIKGEETWRDALARDEKARKSTVKKTAGTDSQEAKKAVTLVKTLAVSGVAPDSAVNGDGYSLIEARIFTGRHHQIRAQAASRGHPLAGDIKYGAKPLPGQTRGGCFFLHAWKIKLAPRDAPEGFPDEIIAPLPAAFRSQIEMLGLNYPFSTTNQHEPHEHKRR